MSITTEKDFFSALFVGVVILSIIVPAISLGDDTED